MQVELKTSILRIVRLDKRMFVDFLELDADYLDSYFFRDDTIDLGYNSEAERISEEMYIRLVKEYEENPNYTSQEKINCISDILEDLANDHTLESQFVLGNETYTSEYSIDVRCLGYDGDIFNGNIYVFVAWCTKT